MKTTTAHQVGQTGRVVDTQMKIPVNVIGREYDIIVDYDWLDSFGQAMRDICDQTSAMIFTSPKIGDLYYDRLEQGLAKASFDRIVRHDIPDGEINKNMKEYQRALDILCREFPDPSDVPLIVNLGGGVVGDLGGFVASTFRRGVSHVQLPTTLLACVDCGIGGKTGVNSYGIKNIIGTVWQPKRVAVDLTLLSTLDHREVRSGAAEVIKYGAITSVSLFELMEERIEDLIKLDREVLLTVVRQCYKMKAVLVEDDEFDTKDTRVILNFGHTMGHAIEMAANYDLTHGEAIAIGMVAAAKLSLQMKLCKEIVYERLSCLIKQAGLPTDAKSLSLDANQVLETMKHDKKFKSGQNCFVLLTDIGKTTVQRGIDQHLIMDAIRHVV